MKILITGATGGIGENLTKFLAQKHQIIAVGRNLQKLKKLQQQLPKNITIQSVDVSDKNSVKKLFAEIDSLDSLINCAGVMRPVGKLLDNNLDEWKKTLEINLLGTVYTCYFALPKLMQSKFKKIINFAGGGSAYPRSYHTAYGVSKTAVVRFTETLAMEYPLINANVIAPGAYKTNMWKDETHDEEPDKWGDMGHLEKFIEYLLSSKSNGITGKFIHYKMTGKILILKKWEKIFIHYAVSKNENCNYWCWTDW